MAQSMATHLGAIQDITKAVTLGSLTKQVPLDDGVNGGCGEDCCSLASSSLQFPAQRVLFREITMALYLTSDDCYNNLDIFLIFQPRIASYIRHLILRLPAFSETPNVFQYLSGLKALTFDVSPSGLVERDWHAYPGTLADAACALV
ncbi:hypothetical protein DXG01_008592 [Tephrocybe rancida]|nr:hypothetical protein DXG01_008592 [Tephrocybe rancida]